MHILSKFKRMLFCVYSKNDYFHSQTALPCDKIPARFCNEANILESLVFFYIPAAVLTFYRTGATCLLQIA